MPVSAPTRHRPPFFAIVREKAHSRWDQLEADPELAGPWQLLFKQIQSPRHVLSELLQNADDAKAQKASARIEDGVFVFEHDGEDFDEEQFASLCRFGYSNKRKLHTIGFRGIGFKSLFSLGDTVSVLTTSLAVRFERRRFSEPIWLENGPPCQNTVIRVAIQDENRARELRANLDEWGRNAISLAFFNSIEELTIGDTAIRRKRLGTGPVPDSEVIAISDESAETLHLFRSPEAAFPDEAVAEISTERNLDDLNLPPCRVEIILGASGDSRLYVVLPTGVQLDIPFSCNAPFIPDPARTGIKPPGVSPTNRWLLRRLGRLAADAMKAWLEDRGMPAANRADAYDLVPPPPRRSDSIADDCAQEICTGFADATEGVAVLLTAEGELAKPKTCLAPPRELYSVWNARQLLDCFASGEQHILSGEIENSHRYSLKRWSWISDLPKDQVLERLRSRERPPKPETWDGLLNLWAFVHGAVGYSDYSGQKRREFRMVPAEGCDVLFTAEEVVRLASNWRLADDQERAFLSTFIRPVDNGWLQWIDNRQADTSEPGDARYRAARDTLRAVGLDAATSADTVLARAADLLFSRPKVEVAEAVRLTHIMATLNVRASEEFQYFTRDGQLQEPHDGVVWDERGEIECLVPAEWATSHFLHEDYSRESSSCGGDAWNKWARSEKSRLEVALYPRQPSEFVRRRYEVNDFLRSRQVAPPSEYPYKRDSFTILDYDFPLSVLKHLEQLATSAQDAWSRVLLLLLEAPKLARSQQVNAIVRQNGNRHSEKLKCDDIPAAWLVRFRGLKCLPDDHGFLREPAELLMRTPSTEPLMHVEPFVAAEHDTPATKPLLRLLGVRHTPSGPDKLLERIRALATVEAPPVHEVCKWYEALDRLFARAQTWDVNQIRTAFRKHRLILTEDNAWAAVDEVFVLANEEDVPDAALVHPSARDLSLWSRIGVAERPTVDLVLRWLCGIESDTKLDGHDLRRVKALLARHPVQIWDNCGHWLSLDNAWTPTSSLRFRVTMRGLAKFGELFPAVKACTADLRMLSGDVCDRYPFAAVKNLGTEVDYRITERQHNLPPHEVKPWLVALARMLRRAKLPPDHLDRVRAVAARLERTVWQPFRTLRVMPYIEDTPAGQAQSPDVFWDEGTLYVKDRPLVRLFDALVAELARPFGLARIADIIKACVDRDASFVEQYVEDTLGIDADASDGEVPRAQGTSAAEDNGAPSARSESVEPEPESSQTHEHLPAVESREAEVDGEHGEEVDDGLPGPASTPSAPKRPPAPPAPPLIALYATARGYRWDEARQRYVHPDGNWLHKCDGSFNWEQYSSAGDVVCRYRVTRQRLANSGIEVAADVWELIKKAPSETGVIVEDVNGGPQELKGVELLRMVNAGTLKLFPGNYLLKLSPQG